MTQEKDRYDKLLKDEKKESTARVNKVSRLVMASYQAIMNNATQAVEELAQQIEKESPQTAAPHLLRGLSYLRNQDFPRAKAAFQRAKTLDPGDRDIDKLLEATQ